MTRIRLLFALLVATARLTAQSDTIIVPKDSTHPLVSVYRYTNRAQWLAHLDLYDVAMGFTTYPEWFFNNSHVVPQWPKPTGEIPPAPVPVPVPTPLPVPAPMIGARYIRWDITARHGIENSIQAADFQLLDATGQHIFWPTSTRITNIGGVSPDSESVRMLLDDNATTKWLDLAFSPSQTVEGHSVIVIDAGQGMGEVGGYQWRTANDYPERDPESWTVDVSADGVTWTRLSMVIDTAQHARGTWTRYSAGNSVPPVVTPPVPPIVPPIVDRCSTAPFAWLPL